MKTKLLASAALAVALGLSSWTAGATGYGEAAATPKAAPANSGTAQSGIDAQEAAKHADMVGEHAPNFVERKTPSERSFKGGVGPAQMFQLRDAAAPG